MYNFSFTRYYNTNSDMHKMNPVYKIICILIFTLLILLTNNIVLLIIMLLFVLSLMHLSCVPFKLYIKNIKFMVPLIVFIVLINLIFNVRLTTTIVSLLKLLLFIFYSSIFIYTTKPNDLTYGLEKVFLPLKIFNIPVNELSLIISLAIRFIPIIFSVSEKVLKSQISRGLAFNGNIKEKCNKLSSVIFPIFVLSFKKSDRIASSLDLKLYRVNEYRTKYKCYRTSDIDYSVLCMHVLLVFIFIVVEAL